MFISWDVLQGRNEEAMALYKQLSRHSAPGVAKKAKQMLFGFTSMDYLKTHTISYAPQSILQIGVVIQIILPKFQD